MVEKSLNAEILAPHAGNIWHSVCLVKGRSSERIITGINRMFELISKILKQLTLFKTSRIKSTFSIQKSCGSFDLIGLLVGILTVSILISPTKVEAGKIMGTINRLGSGVHLELQGKEQWDYDLERKKGDGEEKIIITIGDLDISVINQLKAFTGPYIKKIDVSEKSIDNKTTIEITLLSPNVETFDYLTDQPSRLIVDFFELTTNEKKTADLENTNANAEKAKLKSPRVQQKNKNEDRKPASDAMIVKEKNSEFQMPSRPEKEKKYGLFDGGDPEFKRFIMQDYEIKESAILFASKENIYLPFPILKLENFAYKKLLRDMPDYDIVPQDTPENKEARLLLTLYKKGRFAVFMKTLDYFQKKYPASAYDEMLKFMNADVYYRMWQRDGNPAVFEMAMGYYRSAVSNYPDSKLADRTLRFLGYSYLEKGDYFTTIQLFEKYIRENPKSKYINEIRLAMSEAFVGLHRFDDGVEQLDIVEKQTDDPLISIEGVYRKGDIYFKQKKYAKAVEAYQKALMEHARDWNDYPNAFYNMGESLFWIGDYKKSLNIFRDFIQRFPSHTHAGYAMTRLGELLEILGADQQRVIGAFLETYFRYGTTPGSSVARVRMLSQRMGIMKKSETEKAIAEMHEIAKNNPLPKMDEFVTIMTADGLERRHEYNKAIQYLEDYYQKNPLSSDFETISNRIVKNINEGIASNVDRGDFLGALKLHRQFVNSWLKHSNRLDTHYNIGRALELAGVYSEADQKYRNTLNEIYAIQGTRRGTERNIFEKLPSSDTINLRLANIAYQRGEFKKSLDYIKAIINPEKLNESEQIERIEIASNVAARNGKATEAISYLNDLISTWKGQAELVSKPYLQMAKLQVELKDYAGAKTSLVKIDNLMTDTKAVPEFVHAEALEELGNLNQITGNKEDAAKYYSNLLELYEDKKTLTPIRYKLGQIYFERGEIQKASDLWQKMAEAKDDFWYRLSQEKLKNSKWATDYKKYLKRIPAMATMKETK